MEFQFSYLSADCYINTTNHMLALHISFNVFSFYFLLQRIVLDMLPYLMDVISPPPTIRALPFITLPTPEQHAITGESTHTVQYIDEQIRTICMVKKAGIDPLIVSHCSLILFVFFPKTW